MPTTYPEVYARWLEDPERFWAEAAEAVDRWFRGGLVGADPERR